MSVTAASTRTLWGAGTSRTMRAHWMLAELDLPYERKPITSRSGETLTPEYTRLNPSQKIPALQEGDFVLTESAAIVNYLAATHGELVRIEDDIRKATTKHNVFLKELGLPLLPMAAADEN